MRLREVHAYPTLLISKLGSWFFHSDGIEGTLEWETKSLVLLSTLLSASYVPWVDPLASVSLDFLLCKMGLRLSALMKKNSIKRILGTYLKPGICKIQFVLLNLTWQTACNLKKKESHPSCGVLQEHIWRAKLDRGIWQVIVMIPTFSFFPEKHHLDWNALWIWG